VVATVTDFLPYFYIAVPRGFRDDDIEPFKSYLNVCIFLIHHVATDDLQAQSVFESNLILKIEKIFKKTLMGYRGDEDLPFLKFTLTSPKNVPTVRDKCSS
jgi:DNA polymerase delta subunit 1